MAEAAEVYFPDKGPDDLVRCPYDETHIVTVRRFPYHLMKERKNYQRLEMKECPFNLLHHVPATEFDFHKLHCPDRFLIAEAIAHRVTDQNDGVRAQAPTLSEAEVESTEDWERETVPVQPGVEPLISRRMKTSASWKDANRAFEPLPRVLTENQRANAMQSVVQTTESNGDLDTITRGQGSSSLESAPHETSATVGRRDVMGITPGGVGHMLTDPQRLLAAANDQIGVTADAKVPPPPSLPPHLIPPSSRVISSNRSNMCSYIRKMRSFTASKSLPPLSNKSPPASETVLSQPTFPVSSSPPSFSPTAAPITHTNPPPCSSPPQPLSHPASAIAFPTAQPVLSSPVPHPLSSPATPLESTSTLITSSSPRSLKRPLHLNQFDPPTASTPITPSPRRNMKYSPDLSLCRGLVHPLISTLERFRASFTRKHLKPTSFAPVDSSNEPPWQENEDGAREDGDHTRGTNDIRMQAVSEGTIGKVDEVELVCHVELLLPEDIAEGAETDSDDNDIDDPYGLKGIAEPKFVEFFAPDCDPSDDTEEDFR